jgi:hypothetical protein
MVKPGNQVEIPITRAITIGGMSADATATVAVLWDDNSVVSIPTGGALTGSGASRTFTVDATHATKQGNAVVAIKGSDGTIFWSWHIWVSNYNNQVWTYNGYILMDRNLGATDNRNSIASRGLLYQWGRKDPFPGGETGMAGYNQVSKFQFNKSNPATSTFDGIIQSIRNPLTMYTGSNSDWLNTHDQTLWGQDGDKSVYDPCPTGWRVPESNGNYDIWGENWTYTEASVLANGGVDWSSKSETKNKYSSAGYWPFQGWRTSTKYLNPDTNLNITMWKRKAYVYNSTNYGRGLCGHASTGTASVDYPYTKKQFGAGVRCQREE